MRGSEFWEIQAFIAVSQRGNFARAAASLGIVPSTLSQTIRTLEERIGVRLFNRTTRSVSLTQAGEALLARVRPAVEELDTAMESVNAFRDKPAGTLRLNVSAIPARMILTPILKEFLAAYPSINLEIVVDNTTSDIVSGRFDAGIRHGWRVEKDMARVQASKPSRLLALASPEYLTRHPMPQKPEDLQRHNCIRFRMSDERMFPWVFEKGSRKFEVLVDGPLIVNDIDMMASAVLDGIGVAFSIEAYVAPLIAEGRLVPLLESWSQEYHSYYLYYPSRRQLPAPLKLFVEFLQGKIAGI